MTTAAEMRDALLEYADQLARAGHLDRHNVREGMDARLTEYADALIAQVEAETRAGLVEALEQVMDLIASGRDGYAFDTARAALAALAEGWTLVREAGVSVAWDASRWRRCCDRPTGSSSRRCRVVASGQGSWRSMDIDTRHPPMKTLRRPRSAPSRSVSGRSADG